MEKTYKIDVDCPNCAAKMEAAVQKLEGVTDAVVSFTAQKIRVSFAPDSDPAAVMTQVLKACRKVDRDVNIDF